MVQPYSPFDKDIDDLRPEDLEVLKRVNEGWYVEYKRELVSASALAKAISAFANSYGGWLFLGVQEKTKGCSVAGRFPGIPDDSIDISLQKLRQSSTDILNPTPFFRTKVLRGPCPTINLSENASVLAVEIPQSHTAPHVHKDGRIYRRVADGSEPKHETDRFVLDQLWRRADPVRNFTREWIERDPEFSKSEEHTPYLRLLLCVDPWQQRDPWLKAPVSEITEIFRGNDASISSIPFDTVYSTSEGIIARQLIGNNPHNMGLTWKLRRDLACDVVVPLPFYDLGDLDNLFEEQNGYMDTERFMRILASQGTGYTQPRIVDLNFVMQILIGVASKYVRLLELASGPRTFFCKARLLNSWRIIPFIDVASIQEKYETYGLPLIMDSTITVPSGLDPDSFAQIDELDSSKPDGRSMDVSILQGILIFIRVAEAFGVPILLGDEFNADDAYLYQDIYDAGSRAKIVQENRNRTRNTPRS